METTNDLRHTINTTDPDGNQMKIEIRLNDECKNGHQDFAITATIWEKDKPRTDRYFISGGCCHDAIIAARPDLQIFVDLHLCTAKGVPMHAIENGFYWLKENGPQAAGKYLRLTPEQVEQITGAEDKIYLQCILEKMGVPAQWKKEADQAIELLEKWTGKTFVDDSKKAGFIPLGDKIKEVEAKIETGYYAPERIAERETAKQDKKVSDKLADLAAHRDKIIKKANIEYKVRAEILRAGGWALEDNCIYYDHSNEVCFNWVTFGKQVSHAQLDAFLLVVDRSQFPAGVTFGFAKK
jgi:hypothetical protein